MQNNKKYFMAVPIILVLLGLAYYFLHFIKTPSYAVNEIRTAIEQKDKVKFQQRVDVDNILNKAFDDLIIAESKINNDNIVNNPFALSVLNMLKPNVTKLMKVELLAHVAGEKAEELQNPKDPVTDAMRRNLERKARLDQLSYKELKLQQDIPNKANVSVVLHNEKLQKDYALNLSMVKAEPQGWQIKEITNLVDVILQMDAGEKAQLAAANKHILERIKKNVTIIDKHLSVKEEKAENLTSNIDLNPHEPGAKVPTIAEAALDKGTIIPCLFSKLIVKNTSKKNITRIYYDVNILDKDKKTIYSYPSNFDGLIAAEASQEIATIKQLHTQLPDDRLLATYNGKELDCNITFTYVSFSDGTVIEPNIFTRF